MQIGNISRTKGILLKVCMEAHGTHHHSPFHRDINKLTVKRKDHAILDGADTIVYIDFDEVEAIGAIIIRLDLFERIEEQWGRAWDTLSYNIKKEEEQNAGSHGKSAGKGKTTQWTRSKPYTPSDFPWELRLAKQKTQAQPEQHHRRGDKKKTTMQGRIDSGSLSPLGAIAIICC